MVLRGVRCQTRTGTWSAGLAELAVGLMLRCSVGLAGLAVGLAGLAVGLAGSAVGLAELAVGFMIGAV